jgi:2-dehydropantoate 2-reductase
MHVTIVGAGALGRVYGARLIASGEKVSFVVRPSRVAETSPFVIEQVNGARRRDVIERPDRVVDVPRATTAILLAVRFDQLDGPDPIVDRLRAAPPVPIVALTPLLPRQRAQLDAAVGRRVVPGLPSVSGYLDDRDVVRYWLTKVASTLLDEPAGADAASRAAIEEVARRLDRAGISAHLERDVAALNVGTTIAFFPLVAAIDAGGGVDGALGDKDLLGTVLDAAKECDALGKKVGKVASWAYLLMRFVGPYTLKPGVAMARGLAPESVRFVETHFGPKLHGQHLTMGEAILALGKEQGQPMPALGKLMDTLRAR